MKIHLSYVAARDRQDGRIYFLAEHNALAAGHTGAIVPHYAGLFRAATEEGAALRAKYSHVLVVIDNHERESYELPDPALQTVERLKKQLAMAKDTHAKATDVAAKAKDAAGAIKGLEAERKAAEGKVSELEKQLQQAQAGLAPAASVPVAVVSQPVPKKPMEPAPKPTPTTATPPATPPQTKTDAQEMLAALSDDELKATAAELKIEISEPFDRDKLIQAILASSS